jgi:hypothetical protein
MVDERLTVQIPDGQLSYRLLSRSAYLAGNLQALTLE